MFLRSTLSPLESLDLFSIVLADVAGTTVSKSCVFTIIAPAVDAVIKMTRPSTVDSFPLPVRWRRWVMFRIWFYRRSETVAHFFIGNLLDLVAVTAEKLNVVAAVKDLLR
jgi:hypothetical protein